jgi:hypothetical protein
MTAPAEPDTTSPTTVGEVASWLRQPELAEDSEVEGVVAAANALVRRWKGWQTSPEGGWGDDVRTGAKMLAARLWTLRNSPAGVEVYGSEGPSWVSSNWADVAMLLQVGKYSPPAVG